MDVKIKVQKAYLWSFVLYLLLISCVSCQEKKEIKTPSYVIGRDTMVQMLAEIHLLESSMGIRIFDEKKIAEGRNLIKTKIYKQYGVSKERFFKSYDYYTQSSTTIDTIYMDVITEISKRQAEQLNIKK